MDFKQPLDNLLQKEVDRKEFLAHVGAAVAGLVGITSLLKALGNHGKARSSGYGASSYGGDRKMGTIDRSVN